MNTRKIIALTFMILVFSGCDPVSQMEANIKNNTAQNLSIVFASPDVGLGKTLLIAPGQAVLFQEGFDVGGNFLAPSLVEYDSVLIKNGSDECVRVYKQNSEGKNIYHVDDYWRFSEPSRRFYKFRYEIESEDIE